MKVVPNFSSSLATLVWVGNHSAGCGVGTATAPACREIAHLWLVRELRHHLGGVQGSPPRGHGASLHPRHGSRCSHTAAQHAAWNRRGTSGTSEVMRPSKDARQWWLPGRCTERGGSRICPFDSSAWLAEEEVWRVASRRGACELFRAQLSAGSTNEIAGTSVEVHLQLQHSLACSL